jgi:cell division protein ZapE
MYLLDRLAEQVTELKNANSSRLLNWVPGRGRSRKKIKGIYFWGGVGRGKTFVMDIFFRSLPIEDKQRLHFHQFMQYIHHQLGKSDRGRNPLETIAREFSRKTRVLCLDEFVVTDIGDAMLAGELLKALFDNELVLVTTSNTPPEMLYQDGLQRARFLPAIDLLMQNCLVSNLDAGQDYRMLGIKQTSTYQFPHSETVHASIRDHLKSHLLCEDFSSSVIVNGRIIDCEFLSEDTIWFRYEQLCRTARSRLDYLEIAQMFNTLVLTGIEQMGNKTNDEAKRFIALIDVLYDHRVKLICSAAVAVDQLYPDGFLKAEFKRTVSRLHEMQSSAYLGMSHRL